MRRKDRGIGARTIFANYLTTGSSRSKVDHGLDFHPDKNAVLPDSMKCEVLMRQIASEHEWFEDQLKSDISILNKNRLYTVKDLRILSKESWKEIELIPIVKDLLREAISHDEEYLKKMRREVRLSREIYRQSREINLMKELRGTPSTPAPLVKKEIMYDDMPSTSLEKNDTKDLPLPPFQPNPIEAKIHEKVEVASSEQTDVKKFKPKPNKVPVGENRLKVRADNGKTYEIDRFCPHAGSDLLSRGAIVGSKIFCSKHFWSFSLEDGGQCVTGGKGTLNVCPVEDW